MRNGIMHAANNEIENEELNKTIEKLREMIIDTFFRPFTQIVQQAWDNINYVSLMWQNHF